MKEDNIPYEIIAAYLSGEADKEMIDVLFRWKDASDENATLFEELSVAWGSCFADYNSLAKSKEKVLKKVLRLSRRRRQVRPILIAATIGAAVGLGFLTSSVISGQRHKAIDNRILAIPSGEVTITTKPGQKSETTLPDGTKIWLNSGTTIRYPLAYGIQERNVTLEGGEIFLDVSKNENSPFKLNTSNGFIRVYGTSFDVRDYQDDATMSVTLLEGSIEHFSKEGVALAKIEPGHELLFHKSSGNMLLSECDAEGIAVWRHGEMKIEKASLSDVVLDMERWYGVDITLKGHIPVRNLYWMTIKTESLREMLTLINKITPIDYNIEGKDVTIRIK